MSIIKGRESLFQYLEKDMRVSIRHLRKTIRRVLNEGVHGHIDGNLSNLVFAAAQEVAQEYGDITVQDVQTKINRMGAKEIELLAEPIGGDEKLYNEMWFEAVSSLTYDSIYDYMYQLVQMGELTGGYEDFFELAV